MDWLLFTILYILPREVTCLPAFYVPRIVVSVCMPYPKPCICNVVLRLVEARCLVDRVLYTFNPPDVRIRLRVPDLVPSGLGLSFVVLVPLSFVTSHYYAYNP